MTPRFRLCQWFLKDPGVSDDSLCDELLPYTPAHGESILEHLALLAGIEGETPADHPKVARRLRRAFRYILQGANRTVVYQEFRRLDDGDRYGWEWPNSDGGAARPRRQRPAPWRSELRKLKRNPGRLVPARIGSSLALVLRHGADIIGVTLDRDEELLARLAAEPTFLKAVVDAAIGDRLWLQDQPGRKDRFDRLGILLGSDQAHRLLTGYPLTYSRMSSTLQRTGGSPTGPGLRLARLCLEPLEPSALRLTDEAIAGAIDALKVYLADPPRIIEDPTLIDDN